MDIFNNLFRKKDSKINTAIKKEREDNIDDLHPVKLESSAEVKKCQICNKDLNGKIYYDYPGRKKGAFKITSEKILCKTCFSKLHNRTHSPDNKELIAITSKILLAMQNDGEKELQTALVAFDKIFNKDIPGDWYTKASFRNLLSSS